MFSNFVTTTHGKWVLAGGHAVIRGYSALVFPIKNLKFTLDYEATESSLQIDCHGDHIENLKSLFLIALQRTAELLQVTIDCGIFKLTNNIPIGAGLGASAAVCVAIAQWSVAQGFLAMSAIKDFARNLENLFHIQSSGLDIAGVAAISGIHFQQNNIFPLDQKWQPCWFLSFCGKGGVTSACIAKVKSLWETNEALAKQIDLEMQDSVVQAQQALESKTANSLSILAQAITTAQSCFEQWGLVDEQLAIHMEFLLAQGSLAVKPTGSGAGGYVLSLWLQIPKLKGVKFIVI